MSEIAEKSAEVASEIVEETVDGVVETVEVVRNSPIAIGATLLVGIAAGVGIGYFIAVKKLGKEFDERIVKETEAVRTFWAGVNKTDEGGDILSPGEVLAERHGPAAEAETAMRVYRGQSDETDEDILLAKAEAAAARTTKASEEASREVFNMFSDSSFDYEEEKKHRRSNEPYILTHDEFFENETDYEQVQVTYYEIDQVVAASDDSAIEDGEAVLGSANLARFGHGSKDENVVYIRNEVLEIDYEVVRSQGSYLEEVLGMTKHDDRGRNDG